MASVFSWTPEGAHLAHVPRRFPILFFLGHPIRSVYKLKRFQCTQNTVRSAQVRLANDPWGMPRLSVPYRGRNDVFSWFALGRERPSCFATRGRARSETAGVRRLRTVVAPRATIDRHEWDRARERCRSIAARAYPNEGHPDENPTTCRVALRRSSHAPSTRPCHHDARYAAKCRDGAETRKVRRERLEEAIIPVTQRRRGIRGRIPMPTGGTNRAQAETKQV